MIHELQTFGLLRFGIYILITSIAWLLAFGIRKLFSVRCLFRHRKIKFIKLEFFTNWKCPNPLHNAHREDEWWATCGTWICEEPGCNTHGKKCFGTKAYWTIHQGEVILDAKAMSNPPKMLSPKETMDQRRAEDNKKSTSLDDISRIIQEQLKSNQSNSDKIFDMMNKMMTGSQQGSIIAEKKKEGEG